ncbi:hypothetical protein AAG570_003429 [Ranatra chinensis]|uniref:SEC7 domain-containing protein n=1 Tax=Ranatra chinensis TaxID=642074 RepID=A0ABD0YLQ0_9HEMI
MEDLLLQIVNESSSPKFASLKTSAQSAYDLLQCQQALIRDPAHELRAKCFTVFQTALETKKSKFVSLALTGLHRMLRDDLFQSNFEPEDDSLWLPSQLLHAVSSILTQSDDTQVEILKVLLNVACSSYWTVNGRIIIQMLAVCSEVYEIGTEAVKTASQAAANQTLRAFVHLLDVESLEAKDNKMHEVGSGGIECFNELIPILQYICSRLDEVHDAQAGGVTLLLLEGLHTVVSSLPQRIHSNAHFTKFLWQKLCPVLIGLMEPPRNHTLTLSRVQSDTQQHNKILYSIAGQLVRVVGCVSSLRPVLESVYHRMLLYPPAQHRLDSLKALTELVRSPSRLVDFAGPILVEDDKGCQQSDMALTRLVMDSLEECSKSKDSNIVVATVTCVATLLSTLLRIANGVSINHLYVTKINSLYPSNSSCDYKGPLTYQTLFRLPKVYRDRVGVGEKGEIDREEREEGDGTSEESSECSSDTDPQQDSEVDEMECIEGRIGFPEPLGSVHHRKIYSKESGDCERDNARHFMDTMLEFLSSLFTLRSSIEIDTALQRFASDYCQGLYYKNTKNFEIESAIVNADGIYLATYSALSLNMKLTKQGYYDNSANNIPITEDEFVSQVEGSGVLVYLSSRWLCELYQQVLCRDLLTIAGCKPNSTLINLLKDLGGADEDTEVLSDCLRLERAVGKPQPTPEIQAGLKLARRILSCCWDSILSVLTAGVKGDHSTVPLSLQALHNAALLCNATGLQNRSGSVFSLLSSACCNNVEGKPTLSASHALSLDIMLSRALELASHAPHSWPHVLKCCLHVAKLEHMLVQPQTPRLTAKLQQLNPVKNTENQETKSDVPTLVGEVSGVSLLSQATTASVLCILSQHIDKLFEDAAVKLKLNSVLSFCSAVCAASERQLRGGGDGCKGEGKLAKWWVGRVGGSIVTSPPLLLTRLAQLMIKAARSGRPLIHIMKLWSVVGPHLMNAACHKDSGVAKLAVTCIHDVMTTLLNEHSELPHFHFNEALFKPFENLLCLELCDTDIQDQVVNCICEFVEGSQGEIRSGWRPLFRALGGVSTVNHVNSLLEVFHVFLDTDNPLVFANAAMDCIQCLLKHVRGNGVEENTEKEDDCRSVLGLVLRCSQMLCSMHSMPSCPKFNTARKLEERLEGTEKGISIEDGGGALTVWAELVEGLASVIPLSPPSHQPLVLETLFNILSDMQDNPGVEFVVYCVTYIVLPTIQRWLLSNSQNTQIWDKQAASFKQYCGFITHLIVKLLNLLQGNDENGEGTKMLRQLVSVMVECVVVPVESIARLGCACLRHIVVTGHGVLNKEQWDVVACGVERGARLVLVPVSSLIAAYTDNCHRYYGDLAHIKVAARKDSTGRHNARLRHLAQQVLLLDSQRVDVTITGNEDNSNDERSYVLLIYEDQNANIIKDCVPLSTLLVSLLAHQMLLQTIGTILLQGTEHIIPSLAGVLSSETGSRILPRLPQSAIDKLLSCLELSYSTAVEFDSRPGLKFLIQKVAELDRAANLYRQAGAAWTIGLIALFDLCLHKVDDSSGNRGNMKEFLARLRQSLEQLCDTYVDVLLDKDGLHSAVDRIDEKITFIIAQTDDLPDLDENDSHQPVNGCKQDDIGILEEENGDVLEDEGQSNVDIDIPKEKDLEKGSFSAEIEKQKEAHMAVWAEMLVSALELLCQLDESCLRTLLPVVFPTVKSLTAHATHSALKHQLANLYQKLAIMYGFTEEE